MFNFLDTAKQFSEVIAFCVFAYFSKRLFLIQHQLFDTLFMVKHMRQIRQFHFPPWKHSSVSLPSAPL